MGVEIGLFNRFNKFLIEECKQRNCKEPKVDGELMNKTLKVAKEVDNLLNDYILLSAEKNGDKNE